ncbi:MAG TPA: Type 1 glutamine amidotransferase-like domain-containing protein [Candidatus Acidoferrales bacterium]|nr:Type 1 glutamine amidotransferase-like domain-containing protein [Candidatus Acidoferrales bacterium]
MARRPGLLVLNGGDEFKPGNEPQDRLLAEAAGRGPAYVVPTAAARQRPEQAVGNARAWFGGLGLELQELPVLARRDAQDPRLAELAAGAGLFYLVGGDPGLVARVLRRTPVWAAMAGAWTAGAALAGSSAGAMALCSHTLIRATWPDRTQRRPEPALAVVPGTAVLPHYNTFGQRWIDSAREAVPDLLLLGLDERTAAVWGESGWRVAGAGRVTVIRAGPATAFAAGEAVRGLARPQQPDADQP